MQHICNRTKFMTIKLVIVNVSIFSYISFGIYVSHEQQFCDGFTSSTEQIYLQYRIANGNWIFLESYNSKNFVDNRNDI